MAGKQEEKPVWFKVPEIMATGGRGGAEVGEHHGLRHLGGASGVKPFSGLTTTALIGIMLKFCGTATVIHRFFKT